MNTKSKSILLYLLIFDLVILGFACGDKGGGVQAPPSQVLPESFSFFDVGVNTPLSGTLRNSLTRILGDDATQGNNVIDLEINYPGFLEAHFQDLADLNRKLNFPPRERVEHKSTRLMFRYAKVKGLDFNYVEILFSDYTQNPLRIMITYKKEHPDILKTLTEKYGEPVSIAWEKEGGQSFAWRKNSDLLILSLVPDQFGNPATQIIIVFEKRLTELLAAETSQSQTGKSEASPKGKTPF